MLLKSQEKRLVKLFIVIETVIKQKNRVQSKLLQLIQKYDEKLYG